MRVCVLWHLAKPTSLFAPGGEEKASFADCVLALAMGQLLLGMGYYTLTDEADLVLPLLRARQVLFHLVTAWLVSFMTSLLPAARQWVNILGLLLLARAARVTCLLQPHRSKMLSKPQEGRKEGKERKIDKKKKRKQINLLKISDKGSIS